MIQISDNLFSRWLGGPAHACVVIAVVLVASLTPLQSFAIQNPRHSVVASGGTVAAQSATHRVSGTIGQVASSRPQSPTLKVAEGFWNTVGLCRCPYIGDLDTNNVINILDVVALVNIAFRGGAAAPGDPLCPLITRADLNCDNVVSVLDVVAMVNTAFRGNDTRCNPCTQ